MEQTDDIYKLLINDVLYIKEQDLKIVLKKYSIYQKKKNMYVIIGNELEVRNGINCGDLIAGIIKIDEVNEKDNAKVHLVLPFTSKLLYANLLDSGYIYLVYIENKHLKNKILQIQDDGNLIPSDYDFLFIEDKPISRVLMK